MTEPVIGIIELSSTYPKAPGNMANPRTFEFPTLYDTAAIAPGWWLGEHGPTDEHFEAFVQSARRLEAQGVRAITTTCGLFATFQERAADLVGVPIFTTPLMLIPMVSRMIGPGRRVGIVTAAGNRIFEHGFLTRSGVTDDTPLAIAAVDACPEFLDVIRFQRKPELDSAAFAEQLDDVVHAMLAEHPDVGALVLECSDIPPYSARLAASTGLPVFDFIALTAMVHSALAPHIFDNTTLASAPEGASS